MNFLRIEPAVIVRFVASLFPLAIIVGWIDPNPEAERLTLIAIPLVASAITAALTVPVKVSVIVGGIEAVLMAAAAWGANIAPDLIPLLSAALLNFGGLLTSARVIPNAGVVDPQVVNARTAA